ncbi:MAG TPA: dihydroneopterin aldolase [Candidatus Sulfotelmatobacter sp.]|nr:dihydroneopterin aldolase [Candidatus Sulfotelmatobacter sp.]
MPDHILLRGIQFFGYHGVHEEERRLGQRFLVDLDLVLNVEAAAGYDDLAHGVDYGKAYAIVMELGTQQQFKLLETLGVRIAQALLERLKVLQVTVRVTKLSPPLPGLQGGVAVEITRP